MNRTSANSRSKQFRAEAESDINEALMSGVNPRDEYIAALCNLERLAPPATSALLFDLGPLESRMDQKRRSNEQPIIGKVAKISGTDAA